MMSALPQVVTPHKDSLSPYVAPEHRVSGKNRIRIKWKATLTKTDAPRQL